ncbi:hypothetical protein ACWF94_24890 [Streptomyces sp. NPDC055078]
MTEMGILDRLFPDDRQIAASKFSGRESATEAATRKRQAEDRTKRAKSAAEAARAGQAWEEQDRRRFR